ncbi:HipA [Leifsonia rubra CMS 76R]|nr:HipA [Leifsonia rubra CMS 76R]
MADLRIELYGELVGHLVGTHRRTFDFVATKGAIEKFGLGSTILSESIPFDLIASRSRASRRRNPDLPSGGSWRTTCPAAKAAGPLKFDSWIEEFGTTLGLVIERYDRASDFPRGRIHQEDMNQALGASKNEKYQEYGGKVSLKRIAAVLGRNGDRASVEQLLKLVTVSQAVGNLDMHGKNISMIHLQDGSTKIAPAYDVVPQTHLASDGRMALAINRKYVHAAITFDDLAAEGQSWGVRSAHEIVTTALEAVDGFVRSETPVEKAYAGLQDDIAKFTRNLLEGRATGSTA